MSSIGSSEADENTWRDPGAAMTSCRCRRLARSRTTLAAVAVVLTRITYSPGRCDAHYQRSHDGGLASLRRSWGCWSPSSCSCRSRALCRASSGTSWPIGSRSPSRTCRVHPPHLTQPRLERLRPPSFSSRLRRRSTSSAQVLARVGWPRWLRLSICRIRLATTLGTESVVRDFGSTAASFGVAWTARLRSKESRRPFRWVCVTTASPRLIQRCPRATPRS